MPDDNDEPDSETEPEEKSSEAEVPAGVDPHLFGIDLGHRGVRPDEVDPRDVEPPPRVKPATRTLTDRLASAAADRDDAAHPRNDREQEPESED
jgi:hypothetical protein